MMEISKRKKTILSILLLLILASAIQISAESIWEGSAAMGRYGEFPFTGNYGASNSFPKNAFVEVENLENGKRTRLIVVDRLSDSGLLMLVSNEAAQELGIYQNDIARIKVRLISSSNTVETPQYDDLAFNPDPDLNPAASLMTPEELVYQDLSRYETPAEPEKVEEPVAVVEPEKVEEPVAVAEPEKVEEPVVVAEPETVEEPVTVAEPEKVDEPVAVNEPEPAAEPSDETETPLWEVSEPDTEPEPGFSVLSEMPPSTDGLAEAEILVAEREVPADIAADSPEKPFDWPETIGVEPKQEEVPEPLYLTMDNFDDVNPVAEDENASKGMHSPDTEPLWPDGPIEDTLVAEPAEVVVVDPNGLADAAPENSYDAIGADNMEIPVASLELLSSGLDSAQPEAAYEQEINISTLPEIVEKVPAEEAEYLTEATDYYSPEIIEAGVPSAALPAPQPEIPEEVIAVLVGDHLEIAENEPENIDVASSYVDAPEILSQADSSSILLTEDLLEASPVAEDRDGIVASAVPVLPEGDDSTLVDVANGYIIPDKAEYTGEIKDFPDYAGASEPAEVPVADDKLAYSDAPEADEVSELPEMTEVPEVVKSGTDEAESELIVEAVPEYDENIEVSLVPAEVRPPELIEDETGLEETEPEAEALPDAIAADHEPEVETPSVAEADETVVPEQPAAEPEETPVVTEVPAVVVEEPVENPVEITMEPAAERPAEPEPVKVEPVKVEPVKVEPELTVPEQVAMVSKLQQQKHYLQLGAFKEKNLAIKAAGKLEAVYPVTILADEASASYKLLLGPLSADESGIMLYNFRAGGYSDAFIRRIE